MKSTTSLLTVVLCVLLYATLDANTYGSVEPIANSAVLATDPLSNQPLKVRVAFANRLLQCGIVNRVVHALTTTGAISTINDLNTHFAVSAGGFAGRTNPSYVYTVIDDGPNAASSADIEILTNGLGYVMSQASAFLLDADNPAAFDFPANYLVINFPAPPPIAVSAAFFKLVGRIDPELFETDTSGYTQFGRAYLSLQSFVPNQQFIDGYVRAAKIAKLEYTPIVAGVPSLFEGGAAFPDNDWTTSTKGEEYLARIPAQSHRALAALRAFHLRATRDVLRKLEHRRGKWHDDVVSFDCR
jgi:hypothetical protein